MSGVVSPAFQLYPNDLLGSARIADMTAEEFGIFMLLLLRDWQETGFMLDESHLARWCRVSVRRFRAAWERIRPCFTERGGRFYHDWLESQRTKQAEWRAKSRRGADATNAKRWGEAGRGGETMATTTPSPEPSPNGRIPFSFSLPVTTPAPTPSGTRRKRRGAGDAPRETWLSPIAEAHEAIYGVGSFGPLAGRFAKHWLRLVKAHGADRCARVWAFSQRDESRRPFNTVAVVASRFAEFDPDAPAFGPEDGAVGDHADGDADSGRDGAGS